MSEKQETIADIIAWARGLVKPGETLEHTYELLNGLANRIEAAQKHEAGNGAKMREALRYVKQWSEDCISEEGADNVDYMITVVDDAVAEPARNCDIGTVDEQTERFVDFARLYFQSEVVRFALNWAQMPYEEGGTK